jgi:hypothetical protein
VYRQSLSRNLSLQRKIRKLGGKEALMDIIAILEIGATVTLLIAHLAIVIRNRFSIRS